jgi:hypothetical protein
MTTPAEHIIERLEQEVNYLPDISGEIVQHLIELGYLPALKANALLAVEVEEAANIFLTEARQSGFFDDESEKLFYLNQQTKLCASLRKTTDTNQGIVIKTLPESGQLNLATRIIHYRLELLGLWPMNINARFSRFSLEKMNELAGFIKSKPLDSVNLLADIDFFTKQLIAENPPEHFVVVFKSPHVDDNTKKTLDRRQAFKRQLIEDFGQRSDFIKYLAREILKINPSKIDFTFLNKQSNNPLGQFIMRLVQVQQWEEGFYNGLLDSDIGEVTIQSIFDVIDFYNQSGSKNIKPHRIITHLHGDFFLFNALFFLQEYTGENENDNLSETGELFTQKLTVELENATPEDKRNFDANFYDLKTEIFKEAKIEPGEKQGILKRIYYGVKKLVKRAFRFARKIFEWITKKVSRMWNFLKNIFRNIFENMRLAIAAFVEGIRFIFGNRIFETQAGRQAIISKYSIDGDSVSIATNHIGEALNQHLTKTSLSIKSLKFTLAIVEGVLTIVIRSISIITWPLLLLQIADIYNKIIASFKEIKTYTN